MSKRKLKAGIALMLSVVTFCTSVTNSYGGFFADETSSVSGGDAAIIEEAPIVDVDLEDTVIPPGTGEVPSGNEGATIEGIEEGAEDPDIIDPSEEITDPSEEIVDPSEEIVDPSGEVTDPSEEITDPSEDITDPSEEITDPSGEVIDPSETTPSDELPSDEIPPEEVVTPEEVQGETGSVYVNIDGNGYVSVVIGGESYVISNNGEKVTVEGEGTIAEYDAGTGYVPVKTEVVEGTVINTNVTPYEGFVVGTYHITIDSGEVVEDSEYSTLTYAASAGYTSKGDSYINAGFVNEEEFLIALNALNAGNRADFTFVVSHDGVRYQVPFLVTNTTTGEAHIVVSDVNGNYTSVDSENSHATADAVNKNDWLRDKYASDPTYEVDADTLIANGARQESGLWFSKVLNADGSITEEEPSSDKGALTPGHYEVLEIPCLNSRGYEMAKTQFDVTEDTAGLVINIGTFSPSPVKPNSIIIHSQALAAETNAHVAYYNGSVVIKDTVRLQNLIVGNEYTITGSLYFGDESEYVLNQLYQMVGDKSVALKLSPVKFEAESTTQDIVVEFPAILNADSVRVGPGREAETVSLLNDRVVVYLSVGAGNAGEFKHEGYSNVAETVTFPSIVGTELKDYYTGTHVGTNTSVGGTRLVDTVEFRNLAPYDNDSWYENLKDYNVNRQTYVMKGTLYDRETGELVTTAETAWQPTDYNGTVDVVFTYDGETDGRTFIAVEELTVNGVTVAYHTSMEDDAQTVWFVGVDTELKDDTTETHVGVVGGERTLTDKVTLSNLIVGETYTIEGMLKIQEDGSDVSGVTASKTFVAGEKEEIHYLTYTLNTDNMEDLTVVAHEKIYNNGVLVAGHTDITDEDQAVRYPKISTKAIDGYTGDEVGSLGPNEDITKIIDTVEYRNLVVGQEYTISGILMDKMGSESAPLVINGQNITSTKTFVAESQDGFIELEYVLDATNLQGHVIVVYEDLFVKDINVVSHRDITDLNQTLYFPSVDTNAVASSGLKEQLAFGEKVIQDTVELNNLVAGMTYTVNGVLYDKQTKDRFKVNGNDVLAVPVTFTATGTTETVTLVFNILDASGLDGNVLVAFDTMVHNGTTVALHNKIDDFDQSVKYPKLETSAVDSETGVDEGLADSDASIIDTVTYSNLEDGATYTVKGTLFHRENNEPIKFPEGYIVAETTFIAKNGQADVISTEPVKYVPTLDALSAEMVGAVTKSTTLGDCLSEKVVEGTVVLEFNNFNAEQLLGYTAVCYNFLYRDNVLVGKHDVLDDIKADVKYPKMTTVATDSKTNTQESNYGKVTTINDTVTLENVTEGIQYTIKSVVVNKATGEPLVVNGVIVESETQFVATGRDCTAEVSVSFDSSNLEGNSYVVFESLVRNGHKVSLHEDLTDAAQSIYLPKVTTRAYDKETGDNEGLASENSTVVDVVTYANLTAGETYTVKGKLYDQETGLPLVIDGSEVTTEKTFTAEGNRISSPVLSDIRVGGSVEVEFNFNSTSLAGKNIVVVEEIYDRNGNIVGHHDDLQDANQTISYPRIETVLTDTVNGTHDSQVNETASLTDVVSYSNVKVGNTYTVSGVLKDRATGESILVNGVEVIATAEFKAVATEGKVEVVYTFDSSELKGVDVVAFESLMKETVNGVKCVADHLDIEDDAQRVAIIDISTEAIDLNTGIHENLADGNSLIKDTIQYFNLYSVGSKYTVVGTLVNGETGEVLKDAEGNDSIVELDFVPSDRNGSIEVEFKVDSSALKNGSMVANAKLYFGLAEVADHTVIEDTANTVYVPEITTGAYDSKTGDWEGWATKDSVLVTTVDYSNLTFGETYVAHSIAINQRTGEAVVVGGNTVEGYITFKASSDNGLLNAWNNVRNFVIDGFKIDYTIRTSGTIEVEIPFDATTVAGEDLVVYTYIYRVDSPEDIKVHMMVARNEDINNADATVSYPYLETEMVDDINGTHDSELATNTGLTDSISYKNLRVGQTYTVVGKLFDRVTGEPILVDGEEVTNYVTFEASSRDGKATILYTFDSSELSDVDVVSKVYLNRSKFTVGDHTDIADDAQRVAMVHIDAEAIDVKTGTHESLADAEAVIENLVTFHNLYSVGETYRLEGILTLKSTGEVVAVKGSADGKVSVEFTAVERNGSVALLFPVDSANFKNDDLIASVKLYKGDALIATYNVETEEIVHIPEVQGIIYDSETEGDESLAAVDDVLYETLFYNNLTKGETYVALSVLVDRGTKEVFTVDGKPVEAYTVFKATDDLDVSEGSDESFEIDHNNRANGTVDLEFRFNSITAEGRVLVPYSYIYRADSIDSIKDNMVVARSEDLNNIMQYISYPKLRNSLVDEQTGSHESEANGKDVLVANVSYSNLIVGRRYEVIVDLVDAETGKAITYIDPVNNGVLDFRTHVVFTPSQSYGVVQIKFQLDSSAQVNKTLAVISTISQDKVVVGKYLNTQDANAVVRIKPEPHDDRPNPRIATEALDKASQSHTLTIGKKAVITDKVMYADLDYGTVYQLHTMLYNKTNDEYILDFWSEFTAGNDWDTVTVEMMIDSRKYSGDTLVVYEGLYIDGNYVCGHTDVNDLNQTIVVPVHDGFLETGDIMWNLVMVGSAMVAIGSAVILLTDGKKKKKKVSEN